MFLFDAKGRSGFQITRFANNNTHNYAKKKSFEFKIILTNFFVRFNREFIQSMDQLLVQKLQWNGQRANNRMNEWFEIFPSSLEPGSKDKKPADAVCDLHFKSELRDVLIERVEMPVIEFKMNHLWRVRKQLPSAHAVARLPMVQLWSWSFIFNIWH